MILPNEYNFNERYKNVQMNRVLKNLLSRCSKAMISKYLIAFRA